MTKDILVELANRWERDSKINDKCIDDSEEGKAIEASLSGRRECKAECAHTLRMVIDIYYD